MSETQITDNTPSLAVPDLDKPCIAIVNTQIEIIETLKNGRGGRVIAITDNYTLELESRKEQDVVNEMLGKLSEIKEKWKIIN